APLEDEIADLGRHVLRDASLERVVDRDRPRRHANSDRRWSLPGAVAKSVAAARSRIARTLVAGMRCARHRGDLDARAVAVIEHVLRREAGERILVACAPLRLTIRRRRPADVGPLVPVEPEPAEVVELSPLRAGDHARPVDVLDAQDESSARAARGEPRDERRRDRAEMEVAGRRRGEATAVHYRSRTARRTSSARWVAPIAVNPSAAAPTSR